MVRKTLKLLEAEIKTLDESVSEKSRVIYEMRRDSENLKMEIVNLERTLETSKIQERKQCEILTIIVKILVGKSQLASKASVIEDLLIDEVDREKERIKNNKNYPNYNSGGLLI